MLGMVGRRGRKSPSDPVTRADTGSAALAIRRFTAHSLGSVGFAVLFGQVVLLPVFLQTVLAIRGILPVRRAPARSDFLRRTFRLFAAAVPAVQRDRKSTR